ncbi:MAG: VWA domain-containing protein [Bacteroidales bacterium]|nr:VWA domain-containing protein [Bacteroidales bacterium]
MFFRFEHNEFLYLLILLPLLIMVFIIVQYSRKKAIKRFGNPELLKELMPDASQFRLAFKFVLFLFAFIALVFTIAKPQFGSKLKEVKRKGVEIMIALDISNSMMAEDIKPNRLERAKRAIASMVNKLEDDKIGLIVFAGDAYIQVPITTDYISAKMFLSSINPSIIAKQGTAIGAAVDLATKSFSQESELNKALIIITDGENHDGDAIEAARLANEKGIVVHTLGMGLPQGAPIPVGYNNYQKDREGNTIITKLNEQMLQQIATAGNGVYIRANNSQTGLNTLYNEINKMQKKEIETKVYSDYEDHFQLLAGIALFFIILELFILERKSKYLKNIKLFKI